MSEYSELIKHFEPLREYMRDFYVYGFKGREDFKGKSLRSYDNERRRIESYLGDTMAFRQEKNGKRYFYLLTAVRFMRTILPRVQGKIIHPQ